MIAQPAKAYDELVHDPFVEDVLQHGMEITAEIAKPNGFKVRASYKRDPTELEFYILRSGEALAHLLTAVQQLEHSVWYMGNFSPTQRMKESGITRASHLLWSVENYIVRTQMIYDRTLILVDRVFHLQNNPREVRHSMIVSNAHVKMTNIPTLLAELRKVGAKYRSERNVIVHQSAYLEQDLRRIEALTILSFDEQDAYLSADLKYDLRRFINSRKREYRALNEKACITLQAVFTVIGKTYDVKRKALHDA